MSEEKKKMSTGKKVLIGIGIYFVISVISMGIISQTDSFKSTGKSADGNTAKVDEPKIAWKKAGMYKVGADIQSGEYIIQPLGDAAYYAVSTNSSGSMDSIVANDLIAGCPVYVTVRSGQYLTVQSAKFSEAESYEVRPSSPIKQGMYRVGRDIPAGEYKVTSTGMATYCAVQKDSFNTLGSILSNDALFEGSKYITVRNGQYLLIKDCTAVLVN